MSQANLNLFATTKITTCFLNLADFLCKRSTTALEEAMWYFEAAGWSLGFAISHLCGVGKVNKSCWAWLHQ